MLAKLSSRNQLTLPKAVLDELGAVKHFDVEVRGGQILLTPVRLQRADALRTKLLELGVGDSYVADAVGWARGRR
jgi:hypothetical protein